MSFYGSFSLYSLLPLLTLPLALVGLIDDRLNLNPGFRFIVQFIVSLLFLWSSPLVPPLFHSSSFYFSHYFKPVVILLLVIAIIAIINFVNFMDGMDGLVSGCFLVLLFPLFVTQGYTDLFSVLGGSIFGFLLWNWSPAKIFLGDVGSTFLGALFAAFILYSPSWSQAFGLLLVGTPLLGDAFFCVLRRAASGHQIFAPHRLHLFQRLHQAGWDHSRVSILYITATVVLSAALVTGGLLWVFLISLLELFVGLWLDRRFALPFSVACANLCISFLLASTSSDCPHFSDVF